MTFPPIEVTLAYDFLPSEKELRNMAFRIPFRGQDITVFVREKEIRRGTEIIRLLKPSSPRHWAPLPEIRLEKECQGEALLQEMEKAAKDYVGSLYETYTAGF